MMQLLALFKKVAERERERECGTQTTHFTITKNNHGILLSSFESEN